MLSDTLTVKELQSILQIGQVSAYKLVRSNAFPVRRVGKCYRIPRESFFEWLTKDRQGYSSLADADILSHDSCILKQIRNGGI